MHLNPYASRMAAAKGKMQVWFAVLQMDHY